MTRAVPSRAAAAPEDVRAGRGSSPEGEPGAWRRGRERRRHKNGDPVAGQPAGGGAGRPVVEPAPSTAPFPSRPSKRSGTRATRSRKPAVLGRESDAGRAGERPRVFTREHLRTRTLGAGPTVTGARAGGAPAQASPPRGFPWRRPARNARRPPVAGSRLLPRPGPSAAMAGGSSPASRSSAQLETTIRRHAVPRAVTTA